MRINLATHPHPASFQPTSSATRKSRKMSHPNTKQADTEETIRRIGASKGVQGVIITNHDGIAIRTTMDNSTTVQYSSLINSLCGKARSTVRDLDPTNDLTFLRIRSKKNEIMIAPDQDHILIVIQHPESN